MNICEEEVVGVKDLEQQQLKVWLLNKLKN